MRGTVLTCLGYKIQIELCLLKTSCPRYLIWCPRPISQQNFGGTCVCDKRILVTRHAARLSSVSRVLALPPFYVGTWRIARIFASQVPQRSLNRKLMDGIDQSSGKSPKVDLVQKREAIYHSPKYDLGQQINLSLTDSRSQRKLWAYSPRFIARAIDCFIFQGGFDLFITPSVYFSF